MTPSRFAELRDQLGWSHRFIAARLGCTRGLCDAWAAGRKAVPPRVAAWMEQRARGDALHPAPTDWRERA